MEKWNAMYAPLDGNVDMDHIMECLSVSTDTIQPQLLWAVLGAQQENIAYFLK
jgi:hypothetical protein